MLCFLLIPFHVQAEEHLQNCDVDDLKQVLKAWNAPVLQREVNDQGVVYYAQWDGERPVTTYGIRIVANEQGEIKYMQISSLYGNPDFFRIGLESFPAEAVENRAEVIKWLDSNLDGETIHTIKCTVGTVELELAPIGVLIVRPADQTESAVITNHSVDRQSFDHKPGIAGSNAYDLTIGAEDSGLTVGKRQVTSDGYSWLITGSSLYGSYTISVETNKQYEIHRAVFSHAGNDVTFFPWAVTLPFEAADIDGVTAWVNACQKASRLDTLITGDAVWTYKPHDNGQHGGVLTLTVDTFEEYSLYLLDQIE